MEKCEETNKGSLNSKIVNECRCRELRDGFAHGRGENIKDVTLVKESAEWVECPGGSPRITKIFGDDDNKAQAGQGKRKTERKTVTLTLSPKLTNTMRFPCTYDYFRMSPGGVDPVGYCSCFPASSHNADVAVNTSLFGTPGIAGIADPHRIFAPVHVHPFRE